MAKFENVEVLVSQSQPVKKSWFARNCPTFAAGLTAGTAMILGTAAHAEGETTNFLAPAKAAVEGIGGDLVIFFTAIIAIVLIIAAFGISKGGIKRGSSV